MAGMHELVTREASLVADFIAVLGEEQAILTRGDAAGLAVLTDRKSEIADGLNAVDAERNALLRESGFPAGRAGMSQWIASADGSGDLASAWESLLARAKEARSLNDLNGQLIATRLQATGEAIAALTQQASGVALYGPDGQAAASTGSRIIDSA